MFLVEGILVGLALGLLSRGSLRNIEKLPVRGGLALVLAFTVQTLLPRLVHGGSLSRGVLLWVAWIAPNVVMLALCVFNWRVTGMPVIALGIALNLLVVVANSGMPVLVTNASLAGVATADAVRLLQSSWLHIRLGDATHLAILADVIPIGGPVWQRGLVSLGDVLLTVGAGYTLFSGMHHEASPLG